jgi:hypothetical protein
MLKNGRLYGSIIPPEVNSLRIRDVSLGEKVALQLIALTEHPVGKIDKRTELMEKENTEEAGAGKSCPIILYCIVMIFINMYVVRMVVKEADNQGMGIKKMI